MKTLIVCILLLGSYAMAIMPVPGGLENFDAHEIDLRIRNNLQNYLDPSQFLLVVRPRGDLMDKEARGDEKFLPGMPGMNDSASGGAMTFVDSEGQVVAGTGHRVPVSVNLVFDTSVPPDQVQLLRQLLPSIAQLDTKAGDQVKISTGRLGRPPSADDKNNNVVDSIVKYRKELTALGIGLLGSIALLLIINGFMSAFAKSRVTKTEFQGGLKNPFQPMPPGEGSGERRTSEPGVLNVEHKNNPADQAKGARLGRFGVGALNRSQLFSRDALLFETIREVTEEAEKHPERLSKLLTYWIHQGERKAQEAATLLSNFGMKETEAIMTLMDTSDVEHLNPHLGIGFDPFSDENFQVMVEARQDILKLTAMAHHHEPRPEFKFLTDIDGHMLTEILRNEPVDTLALVATQVSTHRLTGFLMSVEPADLGLFFQKFCKLEYVEDVKWERTASHLEDKYKKIRSSTVSERTKSVAVLNMVSQIKNTELQKQIVKKIDEVSPDISKKIRESLVMFDDIVSMSDRALRLFLLELDVFTILKGFNRMEAGFLDKVATHLAKSNAEIFSFERAGKHWYTEEEVEVAQGEMVEHALRLIDNGTIQSAEIRTRRQNLAVAPAKKTA